jgi:hypothetical protein
MASDAQFALIAEITRRMKQSKVAEFGDSPDESDADIFNFTVGIRDEKQHFIVYHDHGPESARQCAYWTALYLSCDVIFQVADARYKTFEEPPDDGQALLPKSDEQREEEFYRYHEGNLYPGALGEAWERGEREGIMECIVIMRYPLVGQPTMANYDYQRQGRKLVWGKIRKEDPDQHSGAIDDYIKEAFRKRKQVQPIIDELVSRIHADMAKQDFSARERKYWSDRGMASYLSTREGVMLVQYLSQVKGLPDAVFRDGQEIDPETQEPVDR